MSDETHVLIILDQSGSMGGLAEDLRGGINSYINDLKADEQSKYLVTIVNFDSVNNHEVVCGGLLPVAVPTLNLNNYAPRGGTPLLDAVGLAINALGNVDKAIVVVFTDGFENASREFSLEQVQALVKAKEEAGWAFEYLGAGQDSWAGGAAIYETTQFAGQNVRRGQHTQSAVHNLASGLSGHTITYAASGEQELVTDEEREVQE